MRKAFAALGLLNECENLYGIILPNGLIANKIAAIEIKLRTGFIKSQKKIKATSISKK